jgi:hypothetical protein
MKPLQAAQSALVTARNALVTLGSSNILEKGSGFGGLIEAGDAEAENLRKQSPEEMAFMERKLKLDVAFANTIVPSRDVSQNAGMKVLIKHGLTAQKVGAGNCQEYAACACSALKNTRGVPAYDAVYLVNGNHIFVAIGQDHDGNGDYPKDFATWDPESAICDPWAEIACLASEYPDKWKRQMAEWANAGRKIKSDQNEVVVPDSDEWSNGPVIRDKKSYTFTGPVAEKTCGCCYITTATCSTLGLPDDCHDLTVLRRFRDNVLLRSASGRADVEEYYRVAPAIVAGINAHPDSHRIYQAIYGQSIRPAVRALEQGNYDVAHAIFRHLIDPTSHTWAVEWLGSGVGLGTSRLTEPFKVRIRTPE